MSQTYHRPISLPSLTPREAVADGIYRAVTGFDRNNVEMFNSAFISEDVTFELLAGGKREKIFEGLSNLRSQALEHTGPMDTTHMLSNVRVNLEEGASTASLTAYALVQHARAGEGIDPESPKYLVAGEYYVELVKDETDGLWKIKKWIRDAQWKHGDRSVMLTKH